MTDQATQNTTPAPAKPRVYRFNTLATAFDFMDRSNAGWAVLLGDDELYWVPVTGRECGRLIKAGYEAAERP